MLVPVFHGRPVSVVTLLEIVPKRRAGHVDPLTPPDNEIHRDAQGILGIVLEAGLIGKGKRQQTTPMRVGLGPHMAAHAHIAVQFAVREGRVGKHGGQNRNQAHTDLELGHGVGFIAEIEIDLDRGRLFHHPMAQPADLLHIRGHEVIARFGNPLDIVERADRLHAEIQKVEFKGIPGRQEMGEVVIQFGTGAVDGCALLARQLNLSPRFKSDIGPFATQGDHMTLFLLRLPAQRVGQAEQQTLNAPVCRVAGGAAAAARDADHFVFRPNPPLLAWLPGLIEVINELGLVLDDLFGVRSLDVLRHASPLTRLPFRLKAALD